MTKSLNIKYQGEIYRDDRMFVMNLSHGKIEKNSQKISKFVLVTFRNTIQLTAIRGDYFDNKEDAEKYIKKIEYEVPLISQNEKTLSIPENVDKWEFWLDWLKKNKLQSTISGYQNVPYRYNSDGGDYERDNYVTLIITEDNKTLITEDMTEEKK